MPLNWHNLGTGRSAQFVKDSGKVCLTSDQSRYIYKEVEKPRLVNGETMKQEKEEYRVDKKNDSEEENKYQTIIINDFEKNHININTSKMEQLSILSHVINYAQYNRNPIDYYKLEL